MTKVRRLSYDDKVSKTATWIKVFTMLPPWAIPIVAGIGWLMSKTPDVVYQVGHAAVVFACIAYFAEDLFKRTIKVKDDIIIFGYRNFSLSDLQSVGLNYKQDHIVPDSAMFEFRGGRRLKLYLSRLKWSELEDLLRYTENKVPACKIDPVLLTLMKCKNAAGKSLTEVHDQLTFPYNSRKSIKDLAQSFLDAGDEWSKSGPIIVSILATPCWLMLISALYALPRVSESLKLENLGLNALLMELVKRGYEGLGKGVQDAGTSFFHTVTHNIAVIAMASLVIPLLWWLIKTLIKPNLISIDSSKITLSIFTLQIGSIPLSEVTTAKLVVPENSNGPENWLLRLERHKAKPVDLMLGAIRPEHKQQFLKSLQKWAPHVVMDAELAEALLPRQERSYTELWLQSLTQSPERKSLEPLAPGQELQEGRFQIIRTLGVGGQGTAYLCKDTGLMMERLNTYVVLKETIFPVFVDSSVRQQALERFEQEALLLQRFDSDCIVRLSDYFLEDHRGYLVLEHVDGANLRQVVERDGALNSDLVHDLARQMCDILQLLHSEGIVHRDFTPDNLILTKEGKLKLIDFNVAHQTENGFSGTIVGKHAFLPPEQFRGKATFASDFYAMGATMYYLLTGQDPEPITQSDPLKVNSNCGTVLAEVVRTATFLDAKKRYASIEDIRVALEMAPEMQSSVMDEESTDGQYVSIALKEQELCNG